MQSADTFQASDSPFPSQYRPLFAPLHYDHSASHSYPGANDGRNDSTGFSREWQYSEFSYPALQYFNARQPFVAPPTMSVQQNVSSMSPPGVPCSEFRVRDVSQQVSSTTSARPFYSSSISQWHWLCITPPMATPVSNDGGGHEAWPVGSEVPPHLRGDERAQHAVQNMPEEIDIMHISKKKHPCTMCHKRFVPIVFPLQKTGS
jgi:hypothetical protein